MRTWDKESGGKFANINRPVAGATHEKELPVGKHPLQLYSLATPNGVKVTVLLEELLALGKTEAEYDAWLINIFKGNQFGSGFTENYPWYGALVEGKLYDAAEFLDVKSYTNVVRWAQEIRERPAVQRGLRVNRIWGAEESQCPQRHDASDLD